MCNSVYIANYVVVHSFCVVYIVKFVACNIQCVVPIVKCAVCNSLCVSELQKDGTNDAAVNPPPFQRTVVPKKNALSADVVCCIYCNVSSMYYSVCCMECEVFTLP